jgi:thiamine-phosphate pyrophosphorylase
VTLPRLHAVTSDEVLAEPGFQDRARALLEAHGPALALHLRGHATSGDILYRLAQALTGAARDTGAHVLVNDRVDVAMAAGCGAHLGRRSIPLAAARALLGADAVLGYSAHGASEARSAMDAGADFVLLGAVWATESHPGEPGAGVGLIADAVAATAAPVVAIGGVTPARAGEAMAAGAYGVGVIRGVWASSDPVSAAGSYLESMGGA